MSLKYIISVLKWFYYFQQNKRTSPMWMPSLGWWFSTCLSRTFVFLCTLVWGWGADPHILYHLTSPAFWLPVGFGPWRYWLRVRGQERGRGTEVPAMTASPCNPTCCLLVSTMGLVLSNLQEYCFLSLLIWGEGVGNSLPLLVSLWYLWLVPCLYPDVQKETWLINSFMSFLENHSNFYFYIPRPVYSGNISYLHIFA